MNEIVKVGQVWVDRDRRSKGREIQVLRVVYADDRGEDFAVCRVIRGSDPAAPEVGAGRTVKIMLRRFKPTSTGYRLKEQRQAPASVFEA